MNLNHEPMAPHFDKWHIDGLPRSAVIHRLSAPDLGDPHDHPWGFTSFVVFGGYVEEVFYLDGSRELIEREPGTAFQIKAGHIHRIVELPRGECCTLVLPGPHERTSGFYQFRNDRIFHRRWHDHDFQRLVV